MRDTERKRLLHGGLCQALYFNIICGTPSHPCVPEGSHKGGLGKLALGVGSEQQHLDCNSALLDSALSCLVQLLFKSLLIPLEYWFPYCHQEAGESSLRISCQSGLFIVLVGATIRLNNSCHPGHPGAVRKYDN